MHLDSSEFVAGPMEVVREVRHKGTIIMVACQQPPSVPRSLIELSSQVILYKVNSPAWLKRIQKANAALGGLTLEKMAHLRPGETYIWSSKATDDAFCQVAMKRKCRPRVTQRGGATKTAVMRMSKHRAGPNATRLGYGEHPQGSLDASLGNTHGTEGDRD